LTEFAVNCFFCGSLAEHRYTAVQQSVDVCAACLARQELQDAYEAALPRLHELDTARHFDEAQRVLDNLLVAHVSRDASDWLRRSVLAHKAMLYRGEGEHGRAVSTYQELKRLGVTEPSERVEYGLGLSRALLASSRPQEAATAVEEALEALELSVLPSGVPLLEALSESCTVLGLSMPERWRDTLRAAATAAGIQLPERANDMTLNELTLYAANEVRSRSARGS